MNQFKRRETVRLVVAALLALAILALPGAADGAVVWGSTGETVRALQARLIRYGYLSGTADGVFGKATYDAVVWFQRKNGLKADGVAGDATFAALGLPTAQTSSQTGAAASQTDSEAYTLARLVHGEARGEPYIGKVAVAAVVLNRVKSAYFPNTVSGVIYQAGAFDAVADGQINLTPDFDSIRAARDALNGWDPTNGCLYYYNPATATSAWIWTREVRLAIGAHSFAI